MNHEDVQKLSNAANAKITLLQNDFLKYFMRAIMAGFFIVVAMIFSNVVGNVFAGAEEPAWGKFLGALVFSIAVLLISMVGGELFTGNNLVMAFGVYDKRVTLGDAGKVWLISYIGNFVGCLILSLIFVWAGASGTKDYFAGFIGNKVFFYDKNTPIFLITCRKEPSGPPIRWLFSFFPIFSRKESFYDT